MTRRSFIRSALAGLFGLAAMESLTLRTASGGKSAMQWTTATRGILLFMNGGPSQTDTFDPKSIGKVAGPFKSIPTSIPDLEISEHLPQIAEQAHHLSVIRSMISREGNHNRARYLIHTGYAPQETVLHPGLGSLVLSEIGKQDYELPQFISIGGPSYGGGALGSVYDPFYIRDPAKPIENLRPPDQLDEARIRRRSALLRRMEDEFEKKYGVHHSEHREIYSSAELLMKSPLTRAFDISQEPESVRRDYGDSEFGKGCLMARRLIETGVKFVEVVLPGWDTHLNNFEQNKRLMRDLDPAFSSLIRDLFMRHLLETTLVIWMGEFGRTPWINRNDGRDHYPGAWTAALAGGGIKSGQVIGATSADGSQVVDRPVSVPDLFATISSLFGIDPAGEYFTPAGRPISFVDRGRVVEELMNS